MDAEKTQLLDSASPNFFHYTNENNLHELLFTKSKFDDNQKLSYIYSILYFITNNNFLISHFLRLIPDNDGVKSFYEMITCVYNDIKKKEVSQSIEAIKKYEKSLSSLKNKDPRFLIIDILKKTLQISIKQKNSNIFSSSVVKNLQSEGSGCMSNGGILANNTDELLKLTNGSSIASAITEQSFISLSEEEKIENDGHDISYKDVIIKVTPKEFQSEKNETKYKYSNFIPLFLPGEVGETFKLSICLKNYLNEYKNSDPKFEKVFYRLPETLIFVIFFGKERVDDNLENCIYDFDEILDLNQPEYKNLLDSEIKNKKYFLSSLIVCKHPQDEEQYFYTYSRKDKDSKYNFYNCQASKVKTNQDIKKGLKKLEKSQLGDTTSYPFVLVYNVIKEEKK